MTNFAISLDVDQLQLLEAGLRYLEVHHEMKDQFRKLLSEIYLQQGQLSMFEGKEALSKGKR